MKKILTNKLISGSRKLYSGETSMIYQLRTGDILKVFTPLYRFVLNGCNVNLNSKLGEADKRIHRPEIVVPKVIAHSASGDIEGYTMEKVNGVDLMNKILSMSKSGARDLNEIAAVYKKIEDAIKESTDMVFPDLCTLSNIFVTYDGKIKLIDYDGIQIDGHKSVFVSSNLTGSNPNATTKLTSRKSKYFDNGLFTKNLDKKSLTYLYLYLVFGSWFSAFFENTRSIQDKKEIKEQVVPLLGLSDEKELLEKLDVILFSDKEDDMYLEDTVFHIADSYNLEQIPNFPNKPNHPYVNRLVKKR